MFLSKLFSIFKRKKDNQNASNGGSPAGQIVTPSAAVGATVGLGQPSQPSQSEEPQQAEAPSPAPEIAQADTPAPSAPSFDVPSDDNKPAEPDSIPPVQPEEQTGDGAQDTTIGSDGGSGTDNPPLNPDPVPPQPSDDPDMGVVTPPPSDDNDQLPTV
jgi:hypothetical protein